MKIMAPGSLADQVHSLIAASSLDCANRFANDFKKSVYHRTTTDPLEVLNRYWRAQVSAVDSLDHSAAARHAHEALTYSGDNGAWLFNFRRYVLPLVIRFNLPYA